MLRCCAAALLVNFLRALFWLVVGIIIFSYHSYTREFYIRRGFLEGERLLYEEAQSQRILVSQCHCCGQAV